MIVLIAVGMNIYTQKDTIKLVMETNASGDELNLIQAVSIGIRQKLT